MTIGELKKKLEKYPEDIEIYAAPAIWMPTIGDPSPSVRRPNSLESHQIEVFEVLESRPAPGFKGTSRIFALIGFNEEAEDFIKNDFVREDFITDTDSVN